MYKYDIYGCSLKSEISLPFLRPDGGERPEHETVRLNLYPDGVFGETRIIFGHDFSELITPFVYYRVYACENLIEASFKNTPEDIACTVMNIPFSLYFLARNELLLHCGCIVRDGKLTAVSAEKGMGKTTLIVGVSKYVGFFSDDTLRVDGELHGFGSSDTVKLTDRIYRKLRGTLPPDTLYRREDGKYFAFADELGLKVCRDASATVRNLVFLDKCASDAPFLAPIKNKRAKEALLLENIVGASFFGTSALLRLPSRDVFKKLMEIDFYRLSEINDLSRLDESAKLLAGLAEA